jgi:hypothetical protein
LCHIHLSRPFYESADAEQPSLVGVKIAPSSIPNSGLGLFATRDFKYGEYVMQFEFETVSREELDRRYAFDSDDIGTAPYGITLSVKENEYADATCIRNAPSFANDRRGSKKPLYGANVVIKPWRPNKKSPWMVWLKVRDAPKGTSASAVAIKKGSEMFVSYGKSYWGGKSMPATTKRVSSNGVAGPDYLTNRLNHATITRPTPKKRKSPLSQKKK